MSTGGLNQPEWSPGISIRISVASGAAGVNTDCFIEHCQQVREFYGLSSLAVITTVSDISKHASIKLIALTILILTGMAVTPDPKQPWRIFSS